MGGIKLPFINFLHSFKRQAVTVERKLKANAVFPPFKINHDYHLERAVADQLQTHLDANNLHVKFQSAYRRGHGTATALRRILNDLLAMIDGDTMLFLFCWILVPRSTLSIIPCSSADFSQKSVWIALSLIVSPLICLIFVRHSLSVETPLVCGVPRGSMLGPFLFSLYTRQLAELIQKFCINYHFFADDSELYSCLPTERESALRARGNVESCCHEIERMMMKNKLKQKTEVLFCGPPSRRESVPVDNLWLAKHPFYSPVL